MSGYFSSLLKLSREPTENLLRTWLIKKRPPKYAAKMMRIEATKRNFIPSRADVLADVNVPLEAIVSMPPGLLVVSMPNQLTVDVEPSLVE